MSLKLSARLAARELRGGLRGFRIFLTCLALGVAAIAAMRFEIYMPFAPVMLALAILGGIGLAIGSSPVLG